MKVSRYKKQTVAVHTNWEGTCVVGRPGRVRYRRYMGL
jgi:hypothetical protein